MPAFFNYLAIIMMLVAFVFFVAAKHPTRIKRFVRHPQLMSVAVWFVAHLLVNGDSRSVLLFSWLGAWAVLEMLAISKRDGAWQKPLAQSWAIEAREFFIAVIIFVAVASLHPYLTGVAIR